MLLLAVREVRMLSLVLSQHQVCKSSLQRDGMQTHLARCVVAAAVAVVVVVAVVCRLLELAERVERGETPGIWSHL